jgi:hypothetical protein
MSYTMDDFRREQAKKNFKLLTPKEQREALQGLSAEELLERLSPAQIAALQKKGQGKSSSQKGKPRRKS